MMKDCTVNLQSDCTITVVIRKVNGGNFGHMGNFGYSIGNDVQYDVATVLVF